MICADKNEQNGSAECLRCGTCCRQGGPALHNEDLALIEKGVLSSAQLVTVRRGEPAHNPLEDEVLPSHSEFIKIKGQGNSWSCCFFDQVNNGCLIYRTRPLECQLLFCQNTEPLTAIMGQDLLNRSKLLAENDHVLALIDRQEKECSYRLVNKMFSEIEQSQADITEELSVLVRKDLTIRELFLRDFPNRHGDELFLFGRPLFLVLAPHGFRLVEKDGAVSLKANNSCD